MNGNKRLAFKVLAHFVAFTIAGFALLLGGWRRLKTSWMAYAFGFLKAWAALLLLSLLRYSRSLPKEQQLAPDSRVEFSSDLCSAT